MLDEVYGASVYDVVPTFIPHHGWTVFDVGANAGVFTVSQARRGARVFSFESHPDCYRHLLKTVTANGLTASVHPSSHAIGAALGYGILCMPTSTARRPFGEVISATDDSAVGDSRQCHSIEVAITSLDSVVPTLGVSGIDLLNIYKDGCEILEGAMETLKIVERVIVEYRSAPEREELKKYLEHAAFTLVVDDADSLSAGMLYLRKH